MKKLKLLLFAAISFGFIFQGCSSSKQSASSAKNVKSIETKTPIRPAGQKDMLGYAAPKIPVVRVGFIGLGMRGPGAVERWTKIPNTKVVALADLRPERVEVGQKILSKNNMAPAAAYSGSEDAWKALCDRDDIDLVYIATDWKHHVPMALYAMEKGKHVAIEVPAAMNMKDIWALINTSERTRKHCMMLENCVYDFFELTTLNMAQKGLFGEVIHAEGAYIHDLSEFWGSYWNNWRLDYNKDFRGDVYPTHGIGPVCQALNIHRGDKMNYLVAVDTKPFNGVEEWKKHKGETPKDFKNGDQTITMIKTEKGKTIQIQHNVMTPRPYSRMYQLTGTKGFANKYPLEGYALGSGQVSSDVTPNHEKLSAHSFVSKDVKEALMKKYKHPIHVELEETAKKVGGHGGMDYIMDYRLAYCLQNGLPLDMDVYDLAEWCCLAELSAISLDNGSAPVAIPDFTRGSWNKTQGYKHAFAK
ncbi:MAG: Gfo/Idh/MocA family oxidoreductase [Chitinophagaceae bacterium]|nr:MAG: Gfo/Idh/MocA family oxidoreductase [Chitinophagaceae bacterium]